MKFSDIRPEIIKRTPADEMVAESTATPRRLSPFIHPHSQELKKGVSMDDLLRPTYNRAGRRANGQTTKRIRLRDNKVEAHWLPVLKAQKAMEARRAEMKAAQ